MHRTKFNGIRCPSNELLSAGSTEHYADAALYDYEYRRRRADVNYYRALASTLPRREDSAVLELGCGSGRILVSLVRDGVHVVGVDSSQPMLRRCTARLARVAKTGRSAHLVRGDFRAFSLARRFPLILCGFNSMMHLYTTEDLSRFFSRVRDHLTPDGLFAFDVLNPDLAWLSRDPKRRWARTQFKHPTTGKPTLYTTNQTYDQVSQIASIRIYYDLIEPPCPGRSRRSRIVHITHRQFFPQELETLLAHHGFKLLAREGGFHGEPFVDGAESQVCRCSITR